MTFLAASGSSKATTGNSNPLVSLLPLILIFGVAYVFFLRPRAQAARRQRDTLLEISAGDEVLTGAGIFGTVLDVESDRVTIETAPGTRITVLRSTIARRLNDPPVDDTPGWDEHDDDEAHGAYHEYEHDHPDEEHDHPDADEHGAAEDHGTGGEQDHTGGEPDHTGDEHDHTGDEHGGEPEPGGAGDKKT